jgi:hypothetical protein
MHLNLLTPKKSINKAYLKEKVNRADIERFKTQFVSLLDKINDKGDEEHLKSLVADFLKFTWYQDSYQINPIGKNDLVIHTGKSPSDPIGVIIEVKSPTNKPEMLSEDKPNAKAMHELVLYYLRERITNNKHDIKQLIATNIYEWFVFDANEFDKKIYRNTAIKKLYEQKIADGKDNPWFYDELKKLLETNPLSLDVTYFDIRSFKKWATNNTPDDDKRLIALYKILSPVHLLKIAFANDSNTLQPKFYSELLHIIGLYEYKEGSKKLISRKKVDERNAGSLLENAIVNIEANDKMSRLDRPGQYGDTYDDRLYTVALELVITWINRILFLKLLEAQLLKYHKGDKSYTFLNKDKIKDFDGLNKLFFRVLAVKTENRAADIVKAFGKVPYLNSSLFETTELEHETIGISALENDIDLPALSSTVLKDDRGKTFKGTMRTIDYLFEFLNAYDFSSEGAEDIQEDNKTLINASVLGLIFEKINGYKDGSFFTPGFITMYMCRETIRRAVVQKFNDAKGWDLKDYSELYDLIKDKKEANDLINSLKICDPAVGSGHFLVSALNELIAIKSDLNILMGTDGRTLRDYTTEVVNDELIVSDENGDPFAYHYQDYRSQIVQQTLFHEKQTIIENCLFGVDINPNSVKICRLRLWIELLKNAYYKPTKDSVMLSSSKHDTESGLELETLPNIDINIKIGNSLISRFELDADLKQALKDKSKIQEYKNAIGKYQNAKSKEEKREVEKFIKDIKSEFRSAITSRERFKLKELESTYHTEYEKDRLFEVDLDKVKKAKIEARRKVSLGKIDKLRDELEGIKNNKIYENAFEWRFEFPEILDNEGDFIGFDLVIGNPPYVGIEGISNDSKKTYETLFKTAVGRFDLYSLFIERAVSIASKISTVSFIIPGKFLNNKQYSISRKILIKSSNLIVTKIDNKVFDEAQVDSVIIISTKSSEANNIYESYLLDKKDIILTSKINLEIIETDPLHIFKINVDDDINDLLIKIQNDTVRVIDIGEVKDGIIAGRIKDLLYINSPIDENSYKLYFGKHLNKYSISDTNVWINYKPDIMMAEEMKRVIAGPGLRMRNDRIFRREKILTRFVGKQIIATYDSENRYYEHTLHSTHISNSLFHIKYVLGLFNSNLFKFYYQKNNSQGGNIFPQVRISSVENLPIKNCTKQFQQPIITLVDQILIAKQNGEDTTTLETQIDQLVYQLYNLTPEEIKIVEGGA